MAAAGRSSGARRGTRVATFEIRVPSYLASIARASGACFCDSSTMQSPAVEGARVNCGLAGHVGCFGHPPVSSGPRQLPSTLFSAMRQPSEKLVVTEFTTCVPSRAAAHHESMGRLQRPGRGYGACAVGCACSGRFVGESLRVQSQRGRGGPVGRRLRAAKF